MSAHHPKKTLPDNFFRTRWQFDSRIKLLGITLLVILPVLLLITSIKGTPAAISPFITTYLDVLDTNSQWAVPYLSNNQGSSLYFAAGFITLLTISLFLLYAICIGSDKDEGVRVFRWPDFRPWFSWRMAAAACFVIMLISNLTLFDYYQTALEAGKAGFLEKGGFRFWYTLALGFRIVCVIIGLSSFFKIFFGDFARKSLRFRRKYMSYFYPSLISIAIIAFVFTQMDQFDSLFVALIQDGFDFALFSLFLFPVSLIVVWFIPDYLSFTDVQYSERNKAWRIMSSIVGKRASRSYKTYRWLYSHKRLFNLLPLAEEDRKAPPHFMEDRQRGLPYPPPVFHTVATVLGLLFITTLIGVCVDIYDRTMPSDVISSRVVVALVLGGTLAYWWWCGRVLRKARQPENLAIRRLPRRVYRRKNPLTDWWFNLVDRQPPEGIEPGSREASKKTFYYVANRKPFLLGFWLAIFMIAILIVLIVLVSLNLDWRLLYPLFLGFLVITPFVFVWLAAFQGFHPFYTFDASSRVGANYDGDTVITGDPTPVERQMDLFDAIITQVMLIFVLIVSVLCVMVFLIGLLTSGWLSSEALQSINPLNLYLIIVNGAIGLLVLTDRLISLTNYNRQYLFLRNQVEEQRTWNEEMAVRKAHGTSQGPTYQIKPYPGVETPYLFWGFALVVIWLATTYIGNSYHEVTYHPASQEQLSQQQSLTDYTEQFLAKRPDATEPVVFIAADGGGLKACYWTLRILHHLDSTAVANKQKPFYDERVFLTSGASGGSIGLSMYTLLKYHLDDDLPAIRERIEKIGSTNFLSGDFAGLLTRFPLNYLPENLIKGGPRKFEDRAEAMARAYLNIIFADDPEMGYDKFSQLPYWHLWYEKDYQLPLFIANTARGEDGARGLVHPLEADRSLTAGAFDLTRNGMQTISFPDAAFLANRFPLMSPPARIIGEGHFLDAGSADNSGLATVYDFLRYMKTNAEVDSTAFPGDPEGLTEATRAAKVYSALLDREVVVVSIRNALSRFVRDKFLGNMDSVNRFYYQPDLTASTAAAVNSGIAGVPNAWDDYLRSPAPKTLGLLDTFLTVNLPFRLRPEMVYQSLGGELKDTTIHQQIHVVNQQIHEVLGADSTYILAPPLGRLLAEPSREFMGKMLLHRDNRERFRWLLRE